MKVSTLISHCNSLEVKGPGQGMAKHLVHDSRNVEQGDAFIALKGFKTDGHRYIDQAISNGAAVVICEKLPAHQPRSVTFIRVENTRSLLGPLAQQFYGRPADDLTLIGITGTNGKTTVSTLVHQALRFMGTHISLLGTVYSYIGNQKSDSRLTTSDPVDLAKKMAAMVESGSTHLVMEVSSHALDQERVGGLTFHTAAFTNLTHDHLDYHGSFEAYAAAKKKLFDMLPESAHAVVNLDDEHGTLMLRDTKATFHTFGFDNPKADYPCNILSQTIFGTKLNVEGIEIQTPLVGRFNAYNVAQAYLIIRTLGFSKEPVAHALAHISGAEGRLERVAVEDTNRQPLVVVDYAHTPDALENVLKTLYQLKSKDQKLRLVFGAGGNRDRTKRPKMAAIAEKWADVIYVTTDNPRDEQPEEIIREITAGFSDGAAFNTEPKRAEAINRAIDEANLDDIIIISGKGHETYQEIRGTRYDFDDRKVAQNALKRTLHPSTQTKKDR